jgi:hypothetical protein
MTNKKTVLSFYTVTGTLKFYAGTNGELENGEQTTDINKAVKFDTRKEAIKKDQNLDAYYFPTTIIEAAPGFWIV